MINGRWAFTLSRKEERKDVKEGREESIKEDGKKEGNLSRKEEREVVKEGGRREGYQIR
jgi:hypothetical protein